LGCPSKSRACGHSRGDWQLAETRVGQIDPLLSKRGRHVSTRVHVFAGTFRFVRRIINFNPDQVSSIAHTFTSTNPSGRAIARITSSVTSVGTPDDLFGQETQTIPVSAIFSRKTDNLFANSLRFLMKTWTKSEAGFRRSEKVTPWGVVPSNRR
jgi:hypothetical protein